MLRAFTDRLRKHPGLSLIATSAVNTLVPMPLAHPASPTDE